jgi:Holliday junction resolvase RusA-like endonuclease
MSVLFHAKIKTQSHYIKKNNKQIRRNRRTGIAFIASSNTAQICELQLVRKLALLRSTHQSVFPLQIPVSIAFTFHYKKNKNGKPTKKIADLSNLIQGPEDALQKAGIILNDKLIESYDGTRRRYDADENILEITVSRFEG